MRMLRMPDAVGIALQSHPTGDRQSVLFAHGFGQNRQAWSQTSERLSGRGHPTCIFDARGHGDSERNPADLPYRGEQFVADTVAIATALRTPPATAAPVLVGASMGGLIGLIAAAANPQLFTALVLVDITPRWESAGLQRILGFMAAYPHGFASLDDAGAAIAQHLPHRRARKSSTQLSSLLRRDEDQRWRWHWDPRLLEEFARDSVQHQQAATDAARQLHARTPQLPVLLISGGRSDLVSAHTVQEFLELVPHARHVHLPDATHMVVGDDNDAFTAAIIEFLDDPSRITPPAAAECVTIGVTS